MSKRSSAFPDEIFVVREHTKYDSYLVPYESLDSVDEEDGTHLAVYRRHFVGKMRIRHTLKEIKHGK